MIIIRNIKLPIGYDFKNLRETVATILSMSPKNIKSAEIFRKSVDARKKNSVHFNCSVIAETTNDDMAVKICRNAELYTAEEYVFPVSSGIVRESPIIIGFGPAGMMAALTLARSGLKPIVIEMGEDADTRKKINQEFFAGAKLNPTTNIQFGEGGAGTFSDGKLNTGISDIRCRAVLKTFVKFGAGEEILYESKPHIGTDILINVVKNLRNEVIECGGQVLFGHKLTGLKVSNGRVNGIIVNSAKGETEIPAERVIIATGHSSRDTFRMLQKMKVDMCPKAFAVGARIEHLQKDIDNAQYGEFAGKPGLGAADYKLAVHLEDGRGVYTFCMCPGGYVINASSEKNGIVTNGMSFSGRDGENANSAVLVGITVEDFYKGDPLDGMYFQENIEQKAYFYGKGLPTCQTVGDFMNKLPSSICGKVKPTVKPGVHYGSGDDILPEYVCDSLRNGIRRMNSYLNGFSDSEALLTFPETRSSSPIRIIRDGFGESNIKGLYPCGEGAGYAGGIMSAAVDGIRTAEHIIASYK